VKIERQLHALQLGFKPARISLKKEANVIEVIWGSAREKPISSKLLADSLAADRTLDGYLYLGYPVIGSPLGPMKMDALLISPTVGLIAFDLVEGTELGEFKARQDEIASMLEVRLKPHPGLKSGRALKFDINVVTFAPAKPILPDVEIRITWPTG